MNTVYRQVESTYQGVTSTDYQFASKLLRMGTESPLNKNSNGKQFVICDIEMPLPDGKKVTRTAFCYEGNYNHQDIKNGNALPMEVGKEYLTTLRFREDGTPDLQLSHLSNANRASAEDFKALFTASGREVDSVKVTEPAGAPTEQES